MSKIDSTIRPKDMMSNSKKKFLFFCLYKKTNSLTDNNKNSNVINFPTTTTKRYVIIKIKTYTLSIKIKLG